MTAPNDQEREIRAARNQSTFRAVNEKIGELNSAFASITGEYGIACECFDYTCIDVLNITPKAYAEVRANPRTFVVLRGHIDPRVERVVAETDGYVVVEKLRLAAEVAELLEPKE